MLRDKLVESLPTDYVRWESTCRCLSERLVSRLGAPVDVKKMAINRRGLELRELSLWPYAQVLPTPSLTIGLLPHLDQSDNLSNPASIFVTHVTIQPKKPLFNDKPMTIETPRFLEWSGDRPIGHPQSATRGPGQDACRA